jgi:hypothetical protein
VSDKPGRARDERALAYGRVEVGRPRTDGPGYHAVVEPPPDYLTDERLVAFNEAGFDNVEPSGDQTPEQARHFAVLSFQEACRLDGIGVPSAEDVFAEMELRGL